MNFEITRIGRIEPIQTRGYTILASFDIKIGEVEIGGNSLVQFHREGRLGVFAPSFRTKPPAAIRFVRFAPDLRQAVTEAAAKAYEAIGGTYSESVPDQEVPARRQWVCAPAGYHPVESPDKIIGKWSMALEAVAGAVERAERHAVARTEAGDDEVVDGLHRTLGIDPAVSETMAEAGL